VITKGLEFVPQNAIPVRNFAAFEKKFSWNQFVRFFKFVRKLSPDLSITFHAPWWVNFALFLARVPKRVGVLSQWHSFLFLNAGVRQKRSRAEKHEAHYNLDLVAHALNEELKFTEFKPLRLKSPFMERDLAQWNLTSKNYFVVHPGMGGSALNWPLSSYEALIRKLAQQKTVVVTGTAIDAHFVNPLKEKLDGQKNILFLDQKINIHQLLLILKNAHAVLAPSTGVVHLAASLDTPTVGIYSPILVERALRWGPLGQDVQTLTPPLKTDKTDGVISADVMTQISVEDVYQKLVR